MPAPATRICRKCLEEKPLTAFVKAKQCKYGRAQRCKKCEAAAKAEYKKYGARSREDSPPAARACRHCGQVKPLEDFRKSKECKWGYTHTCKACDVDQHYDTDDKRAGASRRRRESDSPEHLLARGRTWQARKHGARIVDPIVLSLVVLERDDGMCGICGEDVDPFKFDVDHIVPLSRGGDHSYANVQLAHPRCNKQKADKVTNG